MNVAASDEGIKIAKVAPSPLQDNLAKALQQLPEMEQATIALSLQRIVDLMEAEQLDAAPILDTGQLDTIVGNDAASTDAVTPEGQGPNPKRTKE